MITIATIIFFVFIVDSYNNISAEAGGFEPPIPYGMPVFETGAFNHSATPPGRFVY